MQYFKRGDKLNWFAQYSILFGSLTAHCHHIATVVPIMGHQGSLEASRQLEFYSKVGGFPLPKEPGDPVAWGVAWKKLAKLANASWTNQRSCTGGAQVPQGGIIS